MAEKEEVVAAVRATLLSCQGALSLGECDRDFKQIQGYSIPYKKLGFRALHELFESVPGFRISQGSNGEKMITVIPTSETKHIANLVARQKSSKKPIHRAPPPRRLKFLPRSYPYNNENSYSGYYKPQYSLVNPRYNRNSTETYVEPRVNRPAPQQAANYKVVETPAKSPKADTNTKSPRNETISKSPKTITPPKAPMTDRTVKNQNGKPLKIVVSPAMANSNPSCVSKAASRMYTLQKRMQEESALENKKVMEKINNVITELNKLTFDDSFKENKTRLLRYCELKKIPTPDFKTHEIPRKGRTKASFDCTVKIQDVMFNTYPNSESTMELAIEKVCHEALKHFGKKDQEKPSTSKSVALQRLIEIINSCPSGYIAKKLPEVYLEKYHENLPDDWSSLVQSSNKVKIEKGVNELIILLPNNEEQVDIEVIEISSTSSSTSSVNELFYPPSLQYPTDLQWNVFVMSANSAVEIWIRIIGEEYSGAFESLNTDMELHYIGDCKPTNQIINDAWYALKCDDGWLRSRILEVDIHNKTALCFLPDTGDEENHPFNSFYDLPNKFLVLPPQAILCQLSGLDQFPVDDVFNAEILSDMLVGKVLIAEVCEIPYDTNDGDPITVVLYDTSTEQDINLNTALLQKFSQELKPPQLSLGISKIFICDVQADGTIYAQIRDEKWDLLEKMIEKVLSSPLPEDAVQTITNIDLTPNVRYLIKSSTGNWLRGLLKYSSKGLSYSEKELMATYIDYGNSEKVPIKNIIRLDRVSSSLNNFPVQVLKLSLHNVPPLNNDHLEFLNKLIPPETSVLCRRVSVESNAVEVFVRMLPYNLLWNVNDAINMEIELANNPSKNISADVLDKKEGIFANIQHNNNKKISLNFNYTPTNGLPQSTMPEKKSQFNIFVLMAANPSNFMVQSLIHRDGFNALMKEMQNHKMSPIATKPTVGGVYLASHEKDGIWRRVIVQSMMSHNMASVYFCDVGHLEMIETNKLRELSIELKRIPAQAIRAKLYGVSPLNQDWSVEDCIRFKEIVVNKTFKSVVENIEQDPIQKNEVLLTLNLIDASNNTICISDLLLRESRARRSM